MDFKDSAFWIWWKEYGKHIEALLIIGLLIMAWMSYTENSKQLKEAREVCPCAFLDNILNNTKEVIKTNYNNVNQLNNFTIDDVEILR